MLAAHLAGGQRREGPVFLDASRDPVNRHSFNGTWHAGLKRAGLDQRLRLHDLRHAYASALIHAGESVKGVQARMGHASAVVTLDVYGHMWPDSDDRTRAAGRRLPRLCCGLPADG